jgi:hypothetical protein
MALFTYKVFGIAVASELECPELMSYEGEGEVKVNLGTVDTSLDNPIARGRQYQVSAGQFLLDIPGVARFLVVGGKSITIDIHPAATYLEVRLFLLGSAFGALIHQRGLLPVHGSAVNIDGSAVIIAGPSGAGKSTLAAAFAKRGYTILTDDVSVTENLSDGSTRVHPGYPQMKLWADSIHHLELSTARGHEIRPRVDKYNIPIGPFATEALPINRIFILSPDETEAPICKQLAGVEKFEALAANTYRFNFIVGVPHKRAHFERVAKLAAFIPVFRVHRPRMRFAADEIIDIILTNPL